MRTKLNHIHAKPILRILIILGILVQTIFTLNACSSDSNDDPPPPPPVSSNSGDSSSSGGGSSSGGSSSGGSSSSSDEISSSSFDICGGFIDGTAKVHYGKSKQQFCDRRDGKRYVYVTTGTEATAQTWMAENLNFNADGSLCYDDDTGGDSEGNCEIYGRLYDWDTAMDNVCPIGWHLPSDAEWQTLIDFAGGNATAGTKLKATSGWNAHATYGDGTDDYGFSALPGGLGYSGGSFFEVGDYGSWWSSSEVNSSNAYRRDMLYDGEGVYSNGYDKSFLLSVRCLKD